MPSLADLLVRVGIDSSGLKAGLKSVSDDLKAMDKEIRGLERSVAGFEKIGDRMASVGAGLTAAITLPLVGAGVAATKFASDFELGMRQVTSLLGGAAQKEFDSLSKQVLKLSRDMGIDAVGATKALYEAISAGVPKDNAIEFVAVSSKAAIAGLTDTRVAVDALTTIIAAYSLNFSEAQKVSDAMFQAVNVGKFTFGQLASAIGPAAAQAKNLGISYEELLAATATLSITSGGVGQAVTQIESAMRSLLDPSKQMTVALADVGKKIGFVGELTGSAAVKTLGFEVTLQKLREATGGNAEAFNALFGRIEGASGALGLTGERAAQAAKDLETMRNSTGAADKAFQEIDKTTARQFERLVNELKAIGIELGTALLPILKTVVAELRPGIDVLKGLVQQFSALSPQVQTVGIALAAAAAAAGPLLFALGSMMGAVTSLMPAITSISSALGTVGLAAAAQAAAVALLAFATVWAGWKYQDHILGIQLAIAAYNTISASVGFFWNLLKGFVATVINVGSVIADKLETPLKLLMIPLGLVMDAYEWLTAKIRAFNAGFAKLPDTGPLKEIKKALADLTKGLGDSSKAGADFGKMSEEMRKALGKSSDATKEAAKEAKNLAKEHQFSLQNAREFMDTQPVLAARLRLVDAEYRKNVESLAALQLALERGEIGTLDMAAGAEMLAREIGHLGTSVRDLPPMPGYTGTIKELDELGKAYERMGITSTGELRRLRDQALADFNTIKNSGISTTGELEKAWVRWAEAAVAAAKQAGEDIPIEIEGMLAASKTKMDTSVPKLKTPWQTLSGEVSTIVTNLSQDLAKMLFDGNLSFAEKFKGALKSLGEAVTSSFIQPAVAALTTFITGTLADLIGGKGFGGVIDRVKELGTTIADVFKGISAPKIPGVPSPTTGGGAPSIPGGGGPSAGSGAITAASKTLGTITAVSSVLSAVTDVLSFLGQRHIEKDVAGIEVTTRAIFGEIFNLRSDSWDRHTGLFAKLDDIWRTTAEGFGNAYVRAGDMLHELLKVDNLIDAVRSIGTLSAVPVAAAIGESIETQLSRARSDLVGAQAGRGGLEALHRSFESLNTLYGRFLFEGPELFAEALRVVGASEADALAVGVSDSLKQNFSTLYGMIASGAGLEDHNVFQQLSLVMGGIQGEMEKIGDYEQLGGQVTSLESTITRLEAARKEREKNTIGHLVDRVDHWGAGAVSLLSVIAEKITGVKASIDTGGGAASTVGGLTSGASSSGVASAIGQVSARSVAIQEAMKQIMGRVDAVRALATGDYAPSAELVSLWTSTTKTAALEYNHLAMELASVSGAAIDSLGRSADLYDLVANQTNPTLENIHAAVASSRPSVYNDFRGATFANRSDIDYAAEQISRNLR